MIARPDELRRVQKLLRQFPVVALIGARQVGKTTLSRQLGSGDPRWRHFFDLEHEPDLARLADPVLALQPLRGLIVLDEIQRLPDLFRVLRVLADRPKTPARFLILGSASPELLRQSSESLAGRIAYHELNGFSLAELGAGARNRLWTRGGFPRSYLAKSDPESTRWRQEFIRSFLERDIRELGLHIPSATLRRFWSMLAHYHGQVWNSSEFARSFGVADTTVRRYLEVLAQTFMVRILLPFSANVGKRQVKAPKIYIADTGILHTLLGIESVRALESHPKCGASWEGFAQEQVIRQMRARPEESYFWSTHSGAELDLLIVKERSRWGFEFKRSTAPTVTKSMRIAMHDLELDKLYVVHAGDRTFALDEKVLAIPVSKITSELAGRHPGGD